LERGDEGLAGADRHRGDVADLQAAVDGEVLGEEVGRGAEAGHAQLLALEVLGGGDVAGRLGGDHLDLAGRLTEPPRCDLELVFTSREEIGCAGAKFVAVAKPQRDEMPARHLVIHFEDPRQLHRRTCVLRDLASNHRRCGEAPAVPTKQRLADMKIVDSGLKTYFKEVCLLEQASVHGEHSGKSIAQVLKEVEGKVGAAVKITGFVRYALGEGIDKQESDFAAEVAAASGQKKPPGALETVSQAGATRAGKESD